jgi:hypothetical protein
LSAQVVLALMVSETTSMPQISKKDPRSGISLEGVWKFSE